MRASYDFETYNWVSPLCIGFIHDDADKTEYFIHSTTDSDSVGIAALKYMHSHTDVKEWWAHNGGCYDGLFLSAAAAKLGWLQDAIIAGTGRVIAWKFKPKQSKHWVVCKDTFALVPAKLKDAAKDFELPSRKLFDASDYRGDMRKLALGKLKAGCLADCRIVLELLDRVESLVNAWGGNLKLTFSSSALSIIKNSLAEDGLSLPSHKDRQDINALASNAYYGSRVEVFNHCPSYTLTEYDINSSYPAAMIGDMPWEFIGTGCGFAAQEQYAKGTEGVYRATVDVPTEMYLPPLPYKIPCVDCLGRESAYCNCDDAGVSGVFFPTGRWEAWFPGCELRYAQSLGVKVQINEGIFYSSRKPFERFITEVYHLKQNSVGATRTFTKYLLNGAYGKFGQRPEHQKLMSFTDKEALLTYVTDHPGECIILNDKSNIICHEEYRWPNHTHYALASYVTGLARIALHRFLVSSVLPAYCDSDSIHCAMDGIPAKYVNNRLGGLKVEVAQCKAVYYAPKIYRIEEPSGKVHYASKGFPITCDNCRSADKRPAFCTACDRAFFNVVASDGIDVGRMVMTKTQMRYHPDSVRRITGKKNWHGTSVKRKPLPHGETRAWDVKELRGGKHIGSKSPHYKKARS